MLQKKYRTYFDFVFNALVFLFITILLFINLGKLPVRLYDESRLAVNTFYMLEDNDFIVTKYDGEPDMWNTKPPFLIWCQYVSSKIFGLNEFALRFPSALSSLFICTIVSLFLRRCTGNVLASLSATVFLVTEEGFNGYHTARFGEYDAMLSLFMLLSVFSFFYYLEKPEKVYLLYLCVFALAFGVLTKSIATLLFLPAISIYAILQKKLFYILKNKHIYFALILFFILTAGYYLLREQKNPGYLQAVWQNDIGGRYVSEEKSQDTFYVQILLNERFAFIYIFCIAGVIFGFLSKKVIIRKTTLLSVLIILSYYSIISFGDIKHEWYTMPVYPFLAILFGICMYSIYEFLNHQNHSAPAFLFAALICLFWLPVQIKSEYIFNGDEQNWEKPFYEISTILQHAYKNKNENLKDYQVFCSDYCPHELFYVLLLEKKGIHLEMLYDKNFKPGQKMILTDKTILQNLHNKYEVQTDSVKGNVNFITILNYEN